jgi:hypothetical protein
VWAKSTKYLTSLVYIGSILHDTPLNSSMDFNIGSILSHKLTATEMAHIILHMLYDQINGVVHENFCPRYENSK